jgi:recombination protein RecR
MDAGSKTLSRLVDELEKLPGIGRKSAERLAYHVLNAPADQALALADAIRDVKSRLRPCARCFHLAEGQFCTICEDESRDPSLLCVVEESKDLLAIEASGSYRGVYHVLQGAFAPLDGVRPKDLTIESLLARIRSGSVLELILATNPDFEGEGTALYLIERVKSLGVPLRITRLARGLPSGSHLEHVSRNIVADAIEGRRDVYVPPGAG